MSSLLCASSRSSNSSSMYFSPSILAMKRQNQRWVGCPVLLWNEALPLSHYVTLMAAPPCRSLATTSCSCLPFSMYRVSSSFAVASPLHHIITARDPCLSTAVPDVLYTSNLPCRLSCHPVACTSPCAVFPNPSLAPTDRLSNRLPGLPHSSSSGPL
jgi:hypothetical protein